MKRLNRLSFWDRINKLEEDSGYNLLFRDYIAPYREGKDVDVPPKFQKAFNFATKIDDLYWDADYHGLDCAGQSCSCKDTTHKKRTYPKLWKKAGGTGKARRGMENNGGLQGR
ncbi:hypothetical protein Ngar_c06530 [Candidatus Nitrososphaera gargensis Ga9.2]|uniref:Uncharacterized protein n=1 Tax=Nitrososphaera gargensis (strain Ga9.2) TaxID=1237085 RepID=K0I8J1_NITGG|nr:hypothetical protein [Candidatus Nitrososphaera gargensis]AFU57596.1 hypothetical protein Ngar_c06530 [Candidatus Nitrososphaera gargensis Ga9.2]